MIPVRKRHRWASSDKGNEERCTRCPARRRMTLVGEGSRSYLFSPKAGVVFSRERPRCTKAVS